MADLDDLRDVIPADTAVAWPHVAACRPKGSVLMGGTALAVHLRHRISRDLDLFCHRELRPEQVEAALRSRGAFVRTPPFDDDKTLNCLFGETKVQFLVVDQEQINEPTVVAGMPVGSVADILATKLKVVGDRGELRDYYDLMCIEKSGLPVEQGLVLYQHRYRVEANHQTLGHIVGSLGHFDDVADDPLLAQSAGPNVRAEVIAYWTLRQPEIVMSFDTT